jgi:hypothetical protein
MVEVQIGHKMKCFRFDNGGKFMSKQFNQFCIENGILRQPTFPYSLQQNGVAKKKNCILVQSARNMAFSVIKCFGQKP